jgi:hypothetical protein
VHVDLRCDYLTEELARLVALGAHALDDRSGEELVVTQDREGSVLRLLRR